MILHALLLAAAATCDSTRALRVLFLGNSFTYGQNMPRMVEGVAASLPGPCVRATMIASGGATLEDHWLSDSVVQRIRAGGWTHVVMNDQSTFGEGWFVEGVPRIGTSGRELAEYTRRFADVIRAAGATPVLIEHWADKGTRPEDQAALDHRFAEAARLARVAIAPAGRAIRRAETEAAGVDPFFSDGHHLSPAGAYVEALAVYAALTGRSPIGAARRIDGPAVELMRGIVFADSIVALVDLPAADAARFQRIANEVHEANRGGLTGTREPPPISAEFPRVPDGGERVTLAALRGSWRGASRVLPVPGGPAEVAFTLGSGADTLHLRGGPVYFAGPVTAAIEGTQVVVRATLLSRDRFGRGSPQPMSLELRGVLRNGVLEGVGTIVQRVEGRMGAFNSVARFEARR